MSSSVRPIDLLNQPAPYQDRYKILQKLLNQLQKLKPNATGTLNKLAIGLEARIAKASTSPQSYRFNMSVLLRDLNKYKGDLSKIKIAQNHIATAGTSTEANVTKSNALEKLTSLLLDKKLLKDNGYITELFAETDGQEESSLYSTCVRCNTKFEKANIMEKTLCRYHVSKRQYDKVSKNFQFPCCGETTASTSFLRLGCKTHDHHVFKSDTYSGLSSISMFTETSGVSGEMNVLALDCEMAYTSLGYEMIRLTIVDFFSSQTIFDEIIKPIGEVIDLNSQFSGVHTIDDAKSLSYREAMDRVISASFINKSSILIGHGLENDLNVMRIVHDRVIDTAVLYSKGKLKSSLKNLAFEYLSRKIQSGEHDSSEDAIAAMDVVKVKLGIPIKQKKWES